MGRRALPRGRLLVVGTLRRIDRGECGCEEGVAAGGKARGLKNSLLSLSPFARTTGLRACACAMGRACLMRGVIGVMAGRN